MRFSRQEYGSGLPFSTPGDLPDPGIEPASLESPQLAGGFFTTVPPWEIICDLLKKKLKIRIAMPIKPKIQTLM